MILINAGHHLLDGGVTANGKKESECTILIRDELKKILSEVLYIPDNLTLKESIAWVNERATPNDLAIDIHLNALSNRQIRGTECYYYLHKDLASSLSQNVATALNIPNRGAKPDNQSYLGKLGWLRNTVCKVLVLECLYLTNILDINAFDPAKIAQGIKQFLLENKFIEESKDNKDKIREYLREIEKLL